MKNFWNKNKFNRSRIITIALILFFLALFVNIEPSFAQVDTLKAGGNILIGGLGLAVAALLGVIAYIITAVVGLLITLIIAVLIQVASYNNIIGVPTVSQGWVIIRDLCNMFFILILLVIAFATILRIESYSAKRLLPKLLIMAVLINFSKTIFGFLIDFSQVIMLTFVNAFKEGGGWFIDMFQTRFLLKIREGIRSSNTTGEFMVTQWSTAIAIIMGVLAAIITLITVTVLLVVLVFRIVMLWIYTILSPLVFFGAAFPGGQKYTSRIWEDFVKQLVVGPMLAFFIWLALTTAGTSVEIINVHEKTSSGAEVCAGIGQFFCAADFQKFIIAIALLIGGLMVTQQMGGVAGSMAGKGMQWAKRAGAVVPLATLGAGRKVLKDSFLASGRKLDQAQMWTQRKIFGGEGKDFKAKSLNYRMIREGWQKRRTEKMREYESGLGGAWQERFDRALTMQGGTAKEKMLSKIPIAASFQRKEARGNIEKKQIEIRGKEEVVKKLEMELKNATDDSEKERINTRINKETADIGQIKRDVIEKSIVLPQSRRAKYDTKSKVNDYYNELKKYDLSEDELVKSYLQEKDSVKKRSIFQHLVDINGVNTLFGVRGKENYDFEGIQQFLKDQFGEYAGDVAEDMSKRAVAAGNFKLAGHSQLNFGTGSNELLSNNYSLPVAEDVHRVYADKKRNEKYSQNFARTTHVDTLVDKTNDGTVKVSLEGVDTLLGIAKDKNRMTEIGKGNYQTRFGEAVAGLTKANIIELKRIANLSEKEGQSLDQVISLFKGKYGAGQSIEENIEIQEKQSGTSADLNKLKEETQRKREEKFFGQTKDTKGAEDTDDND